MFSVAEINEPDKLATFSLVWRSLWDRTPSRSLFQTREWLDCYWRHFGADRQLRVLLVLSATRPIGIVPLVIKRTDTSVGSLRVLTYPLDGWGPFFGPIGSDPTATMFGALKHLAQTAGDWDLLDLRGIDDHRIDKGRTANAFRLSNLAMTRRVWDHPLEIDLSEWTTGDQFLLRRRLKDAEKLLWQRGGWEFVRRRVRDVDPVAAAESRWLLEEAMPVLVPANGRAAWLADVQEAALCSGTADLCVLRLNGRIIAAALSSVTGETAIPIAIGVEPSQPDEADIVLVGRMLIEGYDLGDTQYLFGPRAADWAADWLPVRRTSHRFTHFAGFNPRAQLLRLNEFRKRLWPSPTAVRITA